MPVGMDAPAVQYYYYYIELITVHHSCCYRPEISYSLDALRQYSCRHFASLIAGICISAVRRRLRCNVQFSTV